MWYLERDGGVQVKVALYQETEPHLSLTPEWAALPFPNHTQDSRGHNKNVNHIGLKMSDKSCLNLRGDIKA